MLNIIKGKNQQHLLSEAARHLGDKIRDLLATRKQVNLAVPGGRSVAEIFQAMRGEELDWPRLHFFVIDERLVPIDHPDSNYRLLHDHLIDALVRAGKIPAGNAHPFIFDPTAADRGAGGYERTLADHGFRYDIIVLSSGEDGHVGALYPHHHAIADPHHGFIVMNDSPKPPPERMTSSLSLMRTATVALLLFVGEGKREAYARFHDALCPLAACPAKLVLTIKDATVFTDLS